jgi:hypothetical protein
MIPFDIQKFSVKIAGNRDPRAPTTHPQAHGVSLEAPMSADEHATRWDEAQAWCRQNVRHDQGHLWSRCRERDGSFVFSFSDLSTGTLFAFAFRGL